MVLAQTLVMMMFAFELFLKVVPVSVTTDPCALMDPAYSAQLFSNLELEILIVFPLSEFLLIMAPWFASNNVFLMTRLLSVIIPLAVFDLTRQFSNIAVFAGGIS